MPVHLRRAVRHVRLITASVVALCLVIAPGLVSAASIKAQLAIAPNVPPPITRTDPATVVVELEATEFAGMLADNTKYKFWGFNDSVPGPMIRVMVGDTVEVHLKNRKDSRESHNINFHAVTGPGGGSPMLYTKPGEESRLQFKAINPGLFVYHCVATHPSILEHVANGMYGAILVEPAGGLAKVDREFFIMQSEFYTRDWAGEGLEYGHEYAVAEHPSHVVYNGKVGSLVNTPLEAKVGDKIRIFFANAGPNLVASWHIMGEIFDKVWKEGSLTTPPLENLQTTLVPAGGSSVVEFKVEVPGTYMSVDHSLSRMKKGAVGLLKVDGQENQEVYKNLK